MGCFFPRRLRPFGIALLASLGLAGPGSAPRLLASETPQADALDAIRQVWPEEHLLSAIELAYKKSGLTPTARGCGGECIGLFQIHVTANRRLIASMGIENPEELLDPVVNSTVAYRLFREAGWTPWSASP
jgi:hypothetical protein